MSKRKVIIVTDGDEIAQKAVEIAASNIGGVCISASAGNPTVLSGQELVELISEAERDPVVVMVDDRGEVGVGKGERAMAYMLKDCSIDVLGVVAVASKGKDCRGIKVSGSVTKEKLVTERPVDKFGNVAEKGKGICGDTLSLLNGKKDLVIIGMGDPGKMDYYDDVSKGSPVTTRALKEVLTRNGYKS